MKPSLPTHCIETAYFNITDAFNRSQTPLESDLAASIKIPNAHTSFEPLPGTCTAGGLIPHRAPQKQCFTPTPGVPGSSQRVGVGRALVGPPAPSGSRPANILQSSGQPSPDSITWPKMSLVLRLRNPGLQDTLSDVQRCSLWHCF